MSATSCGIPIVKAGVEFISTQWIPLGIADYSPYLTKVRRANPDVLILCMGGGSSYDIIFKQITELGGWGDIQPFCLLAVTEAAVGLPGAEGIYSDLFWSPDLPNPEARALADLWKDKAGWDIDTNVASFYASFWAPIKAIEMAGSDDREDIRDAARSGKLTWEDSPWGSITYGKDGYMGNIHSVIEQVQDGQLVLVWP